MATGSLHGFGVFAVKKREARIRRDPRTGRDSRGVREGGPDVQEGQEHVPSAQPERWTRILHPLLCQFRRGTADLPVAPRWQRPLLMYVSAEFYNSYPWGAFFCTLS